MDQASKGDLAVADAAQMLFDFTSAAAAIPVDPAPPIDDPDIADDALAQLVNLSTMPSTIHGNTEPMPPPVPASHPPDGRESIASTKLQRRASSRKFIEYEHTGVKKREIRKTTLARIPQQASMNPDFVESEQPIIQYKKAGLKEKVKGHSKPKKIKPSPRTAVKLTRKTRQGNSNLLPSSTNSLHKQSLMSSSSSSLLANSSSSIYMNSANSTGDLEANGCHKPKIGPVPQIQTDSFQDIYAKVTLSASASLRELKKHKSRSNEVYGEAFPSLIDSIRNNLEIKSSDIFYDIGSGIGNVVMQIAAQSGCKCFGVEIRQDLHEIAKKMHAEFLQEFESIGVKMGEVVFTCSNALQEPLALLESTIVYLNNYCFPENMAQPLEHFFCETLQHGTRVITLKELFPRTRPTTERFARSLATLFKYPCEKYQAPEGCVSWMTQGFCYYVYTVDRESWSSITDSGSSFVRPMRTRHSTSRESSASLSHSVQPTTLEKVQLRQSSNVVLSSSSSSAIGTSTAPDSNPSKMISGNEDQPPSALNGISNHPPTSSSNLPSSSSTNVASLTKSDEILRQKFSATLEFAQSIDEKWRNKSTYIEVLKAQLQSLESSLGQLGVKRKNALKKLDTQFSKLPQSLLNSSESTSENGVIAVARKLLSGESVDSSMISSSGVTSKLRESSSTFFTTTTTTTTKSSTSKDDKPPAMRTRSRRPPHHQSTASSQVAWSSHNVTPTPLSTFFLHVCELLGENGSLTVPSLATHLQSKHAAYSKIDSIVLESKLHSFLSQYPTFSSSESKMVVKTETVASSKILWKLNDPKEFPFSAPRESTFIDWTDSHGDKSRTNEDLMNIIQSKSDDKMDIDGPVEAAETNQIDSQNDSIVHDGDEEDGEAVEPGGDDSDEEDEEEEEEEEEEEREENEESSTSEVESEKVVQGEDIDRNGRSKEDEEEEDDQDVVVRPGKRKLDDSDYPILPKRSKNSSNSTPHTPPRDLIESSDMDSSSTATHVSSHSAHTHRDVDAIAGAEAQSRE